MFERAHLVGFLLLALCATGGAILVYSIVTGTSFRYTGPAWLAPVLVIAFLGATIYGLISSNRGRGRWPEPPTRPRGWRWPWARREDPER